MRGDASQVAIAQSDDEGACAEASQQHAVNEWTTRQLITHKERGRARIEMLDNPNKVAGTIANRISEEIAVKRIPSRMDVSSVPAEAATSGRAIGTQDDAPWDEIAQRRQDESGQRSQKRQNYAAQRRSYASNNVVTYYMSVTAAGISRFSRMSPTEASQAGSFKAKPQPARKLRPRINQGLTKPSAT